jgi:hypothetical protein
MARKKGYWKAREKEERDKERMAGKRVLDNDGGKEGRCKT